jgi:hypothetical protein
LLGEHLAVGVEGHLVSFVWYVVSLQGLRGQRPSQQTVSHPSLSIRRRSMRSASAS